MVSTPWRNTTLQTERKVIACRAAVVFLGPQRDVGRNPANGVVVYYSLKAKPTSDVELEFLDPAGKSIRKFTARAEAGRTAGDAGASAG